MTQAVILGCEGPRLSARERDFLRAADPFGFILFARNCQTPGQIRRLVDDLRACVGRGDAPVLIDQEGGRVARLRPPHWRAAPPPAVFGALAARDPVTGIEAARLNAQIMGAELLDLGVDVDCTPLLDLRIEGADAVIGDRAFARDPAVVAKLGRAVCEGMMQAGVTPVVKHIPGHGRAGVDSHLSLPRVETERAVLSESDFQPFRLLADAPWAMTAHIVYETIDAERPATVSSQVISEVIRGEIGFQGVLLSDDLSMEALSGSLGRRAAASLAAGCDLILHCNGKLEEMEAVIAASSPLRGESLRRINTAREKVATQRRPLPRDAMARLDGLMAAV